MKDLFWGIVALFIGVSLSYGLFVAGKALFILIAFFFEVIKQRW